MNEGRTRPFEPYEENPDEEDLEPPLRPRVLWGRIVALVIVLLLAFLLGRLTGSGGGISSSAYDRVKSQLDAARAATGSLQSKLDKATAKAGHQAPGSAPAAAPSPSPSPSASGGAPSSYTVKPGDTINSIAEKVYGDVGLGNAILRANNITDPSTLSVGDVLTIPPQPSP